MIGIPQLRENNPRYLGKYSHPSIVIWYWSPVADKRQVSITCNSSAISSRIYEKLIGYSQQIDSSGRMELYILVSFGLMSAQPNKTACLSYNWCMPNSSRIRQSLTDAFWKRIDDVAQRFSNFIANSLELPQLALSHRYVEQMYENQITINLLLNLMVSEECPTKHFFIFFWLRWMLRTKIVYIMSQTSSIPICLGTGIIITWYFSIRIMLCVGCYIHKL